MNHTGMYLSTLKGRKWTESFNNVINCVSNTGFWGSMGALGPCPCLKGHMSWCQLGEASVGMWGAEVPWRSCSGPPSLCLQCSRSGQEDGWTGVSQQITLLPGWPWGDALGPLALLMAEHPQGLLQPASGGVGAVGLWDAPAQGGRKSVC